MTAFAHIMTNHANRAVTVKVASKNLKVVIIYFDDISMYSGYMPFRQSVVNEEQIFNAAVSFKTCT